MEDELITGHRWGCKDVLFRSADGYCYHMTFNSEECEIYGGLLWIIVFDDK